MSFIVESDPNLCMPFLITYVMYSHMGLVMDAMFWCHYCKICYVTHFIQGCKRMLYSWVPPLNFIGLVILCPKWFCVKIYGRCYSVLCITKNWYILQFPLRFELNILRKYDLVITIKLFPIHWNDYIKFCIYFSFFQVISQTLWQNRIGSHNPFANNLQSFQCAV